MATLAVSSSSTPASTTLPVFLKQRDISNSATQRPTVLEICVAAERVSGTGSIVGAQNIRGLWRIYPATKDARNTLLIQGICLRDVRVQVCDSNPFSLHDNMGVEKPSTKVWIDNIPISVADTEIEQSLVKLGCELRSGIKHERARDSDNKLTRFLTGRRFVFITVPSAPLGKTMIVSLFTASVFHKEQKIAQKKVFCSKCLSSGHHFTVCTNDIVCRTCKKSGHKRGDPVCELDSCYDRRSSSHTAQSADSGVSQGGGVFTVVDTLPTSVGVSSDNNSDSLRDHSARAALRTTTLRSATSDKRSRSESAKRRRSKDNDSPSGSSGEHQRQKRLDFWIQSEEEEARLNASGCG